MPALKIAEPLVLEFRRHRAANDSFKTSSSTVFQGLNKRVGCFANRNDEYAAIAAEVISLITNSQDSALTTYCSREAALNAGTIRGLMEKSPRKFS